MKTTIHLTILLLAGVITMASCYNYDGPTRIRREVNTQVNRPPIKKIPKQQSKRSTNNSRIVKARKTKTAEQYLQNMANEISNALPSAHVQMLQDSIKVLFPDNIRYKSSSVIPLEDISNESKQLAKLITKYEMTNVLVTGHTDKVGNETTNKKISELRAKYIMDLLLAL